MVGGPHQALRYLHRWRWQTIGGRGEARHTGRGIGPKSSAGWAAFRDRLGPKSLYVIVARAYPKGFALNPSTRTAEARPEERVGGRSMARGDRIRVVGYDAYGLPIYDWELSARCGYYSVLRSGCPFYGYSSYGSPYYGYSPYGYPYYGYGYRYGGGYGYGYGWYPGTQPVVVVVQSSQPTRERGRVVNGRGYSQGDRTTTSGPSSSTTRSGSSGSSGSSAGSSGASASSGRTAVPRKP